LLFNFLVILILVKFRTLLNLGSYLSSNSKDVFLIKHFIPSLLFILKVLVIVLVRGWLLMLLYVFITFIRLVIYAYM
jgi:hypothetical protein